MKALRSHQMITGFFLENPVAAIPQILHCGEGLCSSRHQLKPHEHAGFEFVYITRGHAFWEVRGQTVQQRMGDLLVTYPREQHATAAEPGVEFHLLWIGLDLDRLGPAGKRLAAQLRAGEVTLLGQCHELESVMRGIFSQAAEQRPLREPVLRQYLRMFARLLEQRLRQGEKPGPLPESGLYSPATNRALEYLRDQLDRRVAVKEIAAKATGGSVTRFCARFKKEVGLAPAAYHQQLRLSEARQALRQPEARVTEVALRYGFSSSQHFSTLFRGVFGVTPRAWQTGAKARSAQGAGASRRRKARA